MGRSVKDVAGWAWSFIISVGLIAFMYSDDQLGDDVTPQTVMGTFLLMYLVVRLFWAWGRFTLNYARRDRARRATQQAHDTARQEREQAEGLQRFRGHVSTLSQYANPVSGQGVLAVSSRGIRWETDQGLRGRADGARWGEVVTFARRGGLVQIEWQTSTFDTSMPPMSAAVQFRGHDVQGQMIEKHARAALSGVYWRDEVDLGPEGEWDSFWSSRARE